MRNVFKRIIEFIKFVIGSAFICVGVVIGGIAGFVVKISNIMVRMGIIMASDLRSRYIDMDKSKEINVGKYSIVQGKGST